MLNNHNNNSFQDVKLHHCILKMFSISPDLTFETDFFKEIRKSQIELSGSVGIQ